VSIRRECIDHVIVFLVVVAPLPDDHFRIVATVDNAPELPSAD
jgi:hypothetical protein